MCFNPRARAGRDSSVPCWRSPVQCFNPRARAGRDDFDTQVFEAQLGVSIHAPVRGATSQRLQLNRCYRSFNPRARAGRDEAIQQLQESRSCFNPCARAGRDIFTLIGDAVPLLFQSTRPCGARPSRADSLGSSAWSFNPRARAGRDLRSARWLACSVRFQSTRPCGARRRTAIAANARPVFQSTRPCGARLVTLRDQTKRLVVSIHAPVRGATPSPGSGRPDPGSFNPRARAGRDAGGSHFRGD